jgi:YD repeat-containing protein
VAVLTSQTDAVGHSILYGYDDANRLTRITERDGRRRDFAYDKAGGRKGRQKRGQVRLLTMSRLFDRLKAWQGEPDARTPAWYSMC